MPVNLVGELGLPFTGFAFDYATGDLWATVSVFGDLKDKIYKINIDTGDTTFIGSAGLNKDIDDIVFDSQETLYGLIGSGGSMDTLITINTTTGTAIKLGSLNTTALYAIAISREQPNGIITTPISSLPTQFYLTQNFPNPFNPSTKIKYSVPHISKVVIKVFDILGNEIETIVNEEKQAGTYEITWYAERLTSGVYFYRIQAGSFIDTKKMIFLK